MNPERFIAGRIAWTKSGSFTRIIIRIAIAAVAISLAVMLLTTAIIAGFKKEISEKIFGFWGHIHITDNNVNRSFDLVPIDTDQECFESIRSIDFLEYEDQARILNINIPQKTIKKQSYGGVKGVHPYIFLPGLMTGKESSMHGVLIKGVDAGYDWSGLERFLQEGTLPEVRDSVASSKLLISKYIANKLRLKTGDAVILNFIKEQSQLRKRFEICGIYNTGLEEYDRKVVVGDIRRLREILDWNAQQAQGMEVILDDIRDMDLYAEYIYYEILPPKLYAESIRSKFPGIFEWLKLQDINETVILQLMILVAIINMITVLLILILERTHMIGVLKSLGASNWFIRKIFLYNAAYIVLFGMLFGNLLGLGIAWLQKKTGFIKLDEANYYLDTAPIHLDPWSVFWINIAAFGVTVIFMVFPTWLISRIQPVKALRFE
jgi:lipoprotein-releasing system permease protein